MQVSKSQLLRGANFTPICKQFLTYRFMLSNNNRCSILSKIYSVDSFDRIKCINFTLNDTLSRLLALGQCCAVAGGVCSKLYRGNICCHKFTCTVNRHKFKVYRPHGFKKQTTISILYRSIYRPFSVYEREGKYKTGKTEKIIQWTIFWHWTYTATCIRPWQAAWHNSKY